MNKNNRLCTFYYVLGTRHIISFITVSGTALRERELSATAVCGHQLSATVVCGHQLSAKVVCGHQLSAKVVCGHQLSATVVCVSQGCVCQFAGFGDIVTVSCRMRRHRDRQSSDAAMS